MDPIPPLRQSLSVCRISLRTPVYSKTHPIPRFLPLSQQTRRLASTSPDPAPPNAPPENSSKQPPFTLTPSQRTYLSRALRVNQAGELAATLIYAAQTPPLTRSNPHLRPLMKHMYDQEANHFATFNELCAKHRVRPTVMYPVWQVAATVLGWSTGLMGREAAMACTEAVETEIGGHYNEQVREILGWLEGEGGGVGGEGKGADGGRRELEQLVQTLRRIRDEELEHLDHAVENDAKEARPYDLLVNVVRLGCRAAIKISQRV
ncbi:catabolite repression protein CAT5 [Paracoccidioides lutzii Pb01]|uniref:5-demethoxyubiquinone hydroxylase, mitochondrial n=1 Tax=Paracoccidioides lutzii (strain ATCC MYA-826 / Pb01) TaxID=502779 RepID=C1GWX2_PARBA|nr:catabolite repression protein CAT5 [Paracoccidioides lutzii Pb01]EEH41060.1 catabolite repression protein CAT5 [Paracoccidioides lutzii Pb01]